MRHFEIESSTIHILALFRKCSNNPYLHHSESAGKTPLLGQISVNWSYPHQWAYPYQWSTSFSGHTPQPAKTHQGSDPFGLTHQQRVTPIINGPHPSTTNWTHPSSQATPSNWLHPSSTAYPSTTAYPSSTGHTHPQPSSTGHTHPDTVCAGCTVVPCVQATLLYSVCRLLWTIPSTCCTHPLLTGLDWSHPFTTGHNHHTDAPLSPHSPLIDPA